MKRKHNRDCNAAMFISASRKNRSQTLLRPRQHFRAQRFLPKPQGLLCRVHGPDTTAWPPGCGLPSHQAVALMAGLSVCHLEQRPRCSVWGSGVPGWLSMDVSLLVSLFRYPAVCTGRLTTDHWPGQRKQQKPRNPCGSWNSDFKAVIEQIKMYLHGTYVRVLRWVWCIYMASMYMSRDGCGGELHGLSYQYSIGVTLGYTVRFCISKLK